MGLSSQPVRNYRVIAAAIVIAGVLIAASLFVAVGGAKTTTYTRTDTDISTATITSEHTVTQTSATRGVVSLMKVNGSYYWADDVSRDIVIGQPGYSYFLNASVTFDGVKFQTICPPIYRDCPGSNSSSTVIYAGAIRFNVTFQDKTTETVGDVIGDSVFTYVLSQHSPMAGMLIEYVNDYNYPNSSSDFAVFLLVSSCGGAPNLC